MLLDESGSMDGEDWKNLLEAVRNALIKINGIFSNNSNTRVSVINFA
jgi:uncharacterized protein with von Willebrand factor type A (vWA) domain